PASGSRSSTRPSTAGPTTACSTRISATRSCGSRSSTTATITDSPPPSTRRTFDAKNCSRRRGGCCCAWRRKAIWARSQNASGTTSRSGLRHTELVSCGWIHHDFPAAIAMDPPAGDSAMGPDDKRTPRHAEMRCRTRGVGAGSQIQRAGSTSSKSAYSEYFHASEYFEACVDPSLVLPEDCPDEDGAPAPLFFGRTLAGMPTALESAATSLTTTALAPTAELSPTTTGPRIFAPEPMST